MFSDGLVYVGGSYSTVGGQLRSSLAAVDPVSGLPDWQSTRVRVVRI